MSLSLDLKIEIMSHFILEQLSTFYILLCIVKKSWRQLRINFPEIKGSLEESRISNTNDIFHEKFKEFNEPVQNMNHELDMPS